MKIKAKYLYLNKKHYLIIKNLKDLSLMVSQDQKIFFSFIDKNNRLLWLDEHPNTCLENIINIKYMKIVLNKKREKVDNYIENYKLFSEDTRYYVFEVKDSYYADYLFKLLKDNELNKLKLCITRFETKMSENDVLIHIPKTQYVLSVKQLIKNKGN